MRILMFGRGVIATIYGRVLQGAGHDVEFLVRPGRAAEYGQVVQLDWIDGRRKPLGRRVLEPFRTALRESIESDDEYDLIVLSVGHHRLAEASAALAPRVGSSTVLVFGNVWDDPLTAVSPLPSDQVVFGFPGGGGGFGPDGVLRAAILPSVVVGVTNGEPTEHEGRVTAAFEQAHLTVRPERDMRGWLWLHFVADAGMFAQARRSGSLAQMVGDRRAFRQAFETTRALLPLLEARGVDLRLHRAATAPYRFPAVVSAAFALATVMIPLARTSLGAHTDPPTREALAVLEDTRLEATRLGVPIPDLDH